MSDDYYEILGVEEDASFEEIKRAFRKKARELHPDVNKADNAEEMFKKLNEAHSILSDPNKRKEYDLRRKGIPSFGSGFPGFGDIFNDIFRGGPFHRPPPEAQVPAPLRVQYDLPVYSALVGGKIRLHYQYKSSCQACGATGVSEWSVCQTCGGTGGMQHSQGAVFIRRTCPSCGGRGKSPKEHCQECSGNRFFDKEDQAEIDVSPGFTTAVFTLEGKGHEVGGMRGPLVVRVVVIMPNLSNLSDEDKQTLKEMLEQ